MVHEHTVLGQHRPERFEIVESDRGLKLCLELLEPRQRGVLVL